MDKMSITEKVFMLKETAGFQRLYESDLVTIASVTGFRNYAPGEIFCPQGHVLQKLYVVVKGMFVTETGLRAPVVMGAGSLLFGHTVQKKLNAAEQGASCLVISKPHFFTIVYQCPALITGLLEMESFEKEDVRMSNGGHA